MTAALIVVALVALGATAFGVLAGWELLRVDRELAEYKARLEATAMRSSVLANQLATVADQRNQDVARLEELVANKSAENKALRERLHAQLASDPAALRAELQQLLVFTPGGTGAPADTGTVTEAGGVPDPLHAAVGAVRGDAGRDGSGAV